MPYEKVGALSRAIIEKNGLGPEFGLDLKGSLDQFLGAYKGKSAGYWEPYFLAIGCVLNEARQVVDISHVSDPLPDVPRDLLPPPYRCADCLRLRAEVKSLRAKVEASEALVRKLCGVLGIELPS